MNTRTTLRHEDDAEAPWLVVPLLLTIVLVSGLGLIFGWSV